ncbi:Hydrophobin [Penicillium expansum]|uniref:Class I hydrophobin A n=1 Tax=Penicillium expansum TaxID=27334 RepID=HFBA_PENEN|nr:Hydrophobin [Penicillium expansum]KGO45631.1 Hydrophobin [Penicillium expansum]KGO62871.1 Hydrophobin [Penicillium expansum]
MQFSLSAIVLGLAATVYALPPSAPVAGGAGAGNGVGNKGNTDVRFSVPDNLTVKQAQAKCGDQAQLSCCNKAVYAGDTTDINSGILGGTLSNLIGSGSGASGLGLFDQCSKLDLQVPILALLPIQDLVNQKCKQNIACCQNSPSSAVSTPPIIDQKAQLTHHRTPTSLVLASPVLPLAPSSKRLAMFSRIMQAALVITPALWTLVQSSTYAEMWIVIDSEDGKQAFD